MIKLIVLVRRAEGVSHDELVESWLNAHTPAVVKRFQPDHCSVTIFDSKPDQQYDGMTSLWFKDVAQASSFYEPQRKMSYLTTELNDGFFELTDKNPTVLACEEHVIVDGPRPSQAVKVTGLVRRKSDSDVRAFYKSWLEDHAPNVSGALAATPGGLRYVISHATLGGPEPHYAGLAEVYYADKTAAQAHMGKLGLDNFLKVSEAAGFYHGYEIVAIE